MRPARARRPRNWRGAMPFSPTHVSRTSAASSAGLPAASCSLVGLRGVGKTVLLNEVRAMAEDEGALADFIEVANYEPPSIAVIATLRSILPMLDRIKGASGHVKTSGRVLTSFVGAVRVTVENVEFAVDIDGEPDVADSGTLSRDLAELLVVAGEEGQGVRLLDRHPDRRSPEPAIRGVRGAHHGRAPHGPETASPARRW